MKLRAIWIALFPLMYPTTWAWRYQYEHVYMVRHHMPFQHLALSVLCQILEYLSEVFS